MLNTLTVRPQRIGWSSKPSEQEDEGDLRSVAVLGHGLVASPQRDSLGVAYKHVGEALLQSEMLLRQICRLHCHYDQERDKALWPQLDMLREPLHVGRITGV